MSEIKVSGFTFGYNLIESGYPIVEAILAVVPYVDEVVYLDMGSTDKTVEVLKGLDVGTPLRVVIRQIWQPGAAGKVLEKAHKRHGDLCEGDITLHFEADEVWDDTLLQTVISEINDADLYDIAVPRIQIRENFQRVSWYPCPDQYVHRVFPTGSVEKVGHTTDQHMDDPESVFPIEIGVGYLWDCASTNPGNYITRSRNQSALWGHDPVVYRMVPHHFLVDAKTTKNLIEAEEYLQEPHWRYPDTPFLLPSLLYRQLGREVYDPLAPDVEAEE